VNSPIIVFNPSGLTDEQVKQVKQALDDAYRAGYETAKEFYQLKMTIPTNPNIGQTLTVPPQQWIVNDCTNGVEQGIYPNANRSDCPHSYVNSKNRALGICGLCGISFDEWHG
jgi:type II secretory pathway pseudopilin PulG